MRNRLRTLLAQGHGWSVCDVGGGAHPFLSTEEIEANGLRYTVLDISADELSKAPANVRKVECDIAGNLCAAREIGPSSPAILANHFDLVFSVMVAEHVADPAT